jgi:NAD(P)-dependent dehydrogenase (short-subunit alcohol dehydrogenase family)
MGWKVHGLSRSESPVDHADYCHEVVDVTTPAFADALRRITAMATPDVCLYCVGIGEPLQFETFADESRVFDANLGGAVQALEHVVPGMVRAGRGHFIGLSSIADEGLIPEAPSYCASKAGLSSYLKSLALALRPRGVAVTNIRLGFVDTKMAKAKVRPMMISADRAASLILRCLERQPIQLTYPKTAGLFMRASRCKSGSPVGPSAHPRGGGGSNMVREWQTV